MRETVGVWCLGLSLPSPTGLGFLSLAFVAMRLRQSSVGPCGHRATDTGLWPLCAVQAQVSAEGGLGLQDWEWGHPAPGPSGVAWVFLHRIDYFFQARVPCSSGVPLCGHHPQGCEWGKVSGVSPVGSSPTAVWRSFLERQLGAPPHTPRSWGHRKSSCLVLAVGGYWHSRTFHHAMREALGNATFT